MEKLSTRISGPVAVIGDVHGQTDKLRIVLDKLSQFPDYRERWIVFIGDFVDRGPDPRGALDIFYELLLTHGRTTAVAGNHELAMAGALKFLPVPEFCSWESRWMGFYNAETTFRSYGVEPGDLAALADAVPEEHRHILANLPWGIEHPHYLFVHAGLDSHLPFDVQRKILQQRDFTLNRPTWLCSKSAVHSAPPADCPFTVVSGHVMVPQVEFSTKRIRIDTTGGSGGDLSCVLLPENVVITSGEDLPKVHIPSSAAKPQEQAKQGKSSGWKFW